MLGRNNHINIEFIISKARGIKKNLTCLVDYRSVHFDKIR